MYVDTVLWILFGITYTRHSDGAPAQYLQRVGGVAVPVAALRAVARTEPWLGGLERHPALCTGLGRMDRGGR